ncbi:retrovirus-related pol polyprotein from transposon TNT 1-94 [Tanacetum coccineum]
MLELLQDSPDMCDDDIQNDQNAEDEHVALANLIANLTLDTEENKKILKLEKYMTFNDRTVDYDKLKHKLNETLGLLAQKEIDIKEGLKLKAYEISVVKEKHDELVKQSLLTKSHYEGLVKEKTKIPYDKSDPANKLILDREETLTLEKESRSKLNKDLVRHYDYTKLNSLYEIFKPATQEYHEQLAHANEQDKLRRNTNVIKLCMYQTDTRTTQTRAHTLPQTSRNIDPPVSTSTGVIHRTNFSRPPLRSTQMKDMVMPNNSQIVELILFIVDSGCTKHMTGNLKLLCNFVEKYLCTVHFGNDQFAPIIDLQGNDLLTGNRGSDLYIISLQETTSSTPTSFMAKASPTQAWLWHQKLSHLNFDYINLLSMKDVVIGSPKLKYVKDQLCTSSVNMSSSPIDRSKQQDTPPTTNIQSPIEPTTTTNVNAKENNDNQAEDIQVQQDEFINPFCTPPVQTRRQLATDPEMCMFTLTMSIAELKNIKEAMADSAWIEAMQEELH